jgi:3-phenylpropionate/trans-cinnamate dioxygenase ferredoxin reductase subunit
VSGTESIVIIGAGHAGGRAAEAMRAAGHAGRITLVGAESHVPYERPPLSKELLAGTMEVEKTYLNPDSFYEENDIQLHLGVVAQEIERNLGRVRLDDDTDVAFDKLLIATGGRVRKLACEGADLKGVHYVRDLADTLNLRPELREGTRLCVIGGGFIGLEVAATARKRGCHVTVVELADQVLARVADPSVGALVADRHRAEGVHVLTGASVERIEGDGEVAEVICTDGETIEVDLVVAGIGILPNVEIAAEAGIECAPKGTPGGIKTDEFGRTSAEGIFAAGDVAYQFNPVLGRHVRLESWANAQNGGIRVARNMVGEMEPFAEVPWFWSDQYDLNLQVAGAPLSWDRVVVRGDPTAGKCIVFYMTGAHVVGATTFNLGRDMRFCKALIESAKDVVDADLADEDKRLRDLAG